MFRSPLFAYRVSGGTSSYPTQVPRDPNEPVRLTRIYTRGGDKGESSLGDGSRVSKLDPRVAAMGDVDELNSLVGWAGGLERIQNELFDLGADLSVPYAGKEDRLRVTQDAVGRLEREIDEANASLPELRSFVLPGGKERAARLFLARAVCRRAERAVLAVPDTNPLAAVYLNRLSDLLFVLARAANEGDEPLWKPGSYTSGDGDDTQG
jgi:cob(I)alamin adenosyltransferase